MVLITQQSVLVLIFFSLTHFVELLVLVLAFFTTDGVQMIVVRTAGEIS